MSPSETAVSPSSSCYLLVVCFLSSAATTTMRRTRPSAELVASSPQGDTIAANSPNIVVQLEQHATSVVDAIRTLVETLRTACLAPPSPRRPTNSSKPEISVDLYQKLQGLPIQQLMKQWQTLEEGKSVHSRLLEAYPQIEQSASSFPFHDWPQIPDQSLNQEEGQDNRQKVVLEVLWPLLHLLARVYTYLDLVPQPPAPQKGQKPSPPPGMLSLQNYTDVACLLEFIVCTSIMVLLDEHVLPAVSQRHLPKSLQGRLPRVCLSWGTEQITNNPRSPLPRWYELQGTAARVAQILLLDRFRPMLLPRHLTDLYGAIWQAQHVESSKLSEIAVADNTWLQNGKLYTKAWELFLPSSCNTPETTVFVVDDTRIAFACQRLLQQGRKAPIWLQRRVSSTMQELAYQNLPAVMNVFCPANDTSAPLRLARTLMTGPRKEIERTKDPVAQSRILQPLVEQIMLILDQVVAHSPAGLAMASAAWTEAHQIKIHTLWAVLDQFPNQVLTDGVLPRLMARSQTQSTDIHRNVRRWTALLLFIPPFIDLQRMGTHFLLASSRSVIRFLFDLASSPGALQMNVKEDALYALQLWSQAVLSANFGPGVDGLEVYSLLQLYSIIPSTPSREFTIIPNDKDLDAVKLTTSPTHPDDIPRAAAELERRAKFAMDKLIGPLSQGSVAKSNTAIPSRLLQILVVMYLSFGSAHTEQMLPLALQSSEYELVTMTLLPLLCEECSVETLLAEPSGSLPLLKLIGLVLRTTSLRVSKETPHVSSADESISLVMANAGQVVSRMLSLQSAEHVEESNGSVLDKDETKLSIASVVLTLFVGLLELGTESRGNEEENVLLSLVPTLKVLSDTSTKTNFDDPVLLAMWSELSEMASHANALIASRTARTVSDDVAGETSDPILRQYLQAERDLASAEPPIRARGVVVLRHLIFAAGKSLDPVLTEEKKMEARLDLLDIVTLSVKALSDRESYVYLAAIQTITAATMQFPASVVRELCVALATGVFRSKGEETDPLTAEQRIKLAESLVAFVRRRFAVSEYLDYILGTLLYVTKRQSSSPSPDESGMIQVQTHRYFTGEDREDADNTDEDKWRETQLRVNTGGPVFDTEEDEMVRGAAINLVSEVARAASPSVVSRFVPMMVECARLALQLETSRPVRRSGALLAASVYAAAMREIDEQDPEMLTKQRVECPFLLALVSSEEESLAVLLGRVEMGADLGDLDAEKGRRFDPATVARCREALALRNEVKNTGILALAQLSIASARNHPGILEIKGSKPVETATSLISVVEET